MDTQNKNTYAIGLVVIVLIAILVGGGLYLNSQQSTTTEETQIVTQTDSPTNLTSNQPTQSSESAKMSYQDGTYSVIGAYTSPGGAEEIGVDITLKAGVVTDAAVEVKATRPISKQKQEDFKANFKTLVVGKNIDDLQLGKVSGSSLTPKGFNDALEKVKSEAGV